MPSEPAHRVLHRLSKGTGAETQLAAGLLVAHGAVGGNHVQRVGGEERSLPGDPVVGREEEAEGPDEAEGKTKARGRDSRNKLDRSAAGRPR